MTTYHSRHSFAGILSALSLSCNLLHAQSVPEAAKPSSGIAFRKSAVTINDQAAPPSSATTVEVAAVEVEDLQDKKETLEAELRYARAKLDAAQKKAAASAGEEADKLNIEIRDWEARIKAGREQLALVDSELGKVSQGLEMSLQGGPHDVVLPGENLEVFVNEDPSFNGKYQVRRGGYIILPQVGRVQVAGKSIDQAEASVRKALQSSQLQRATVMIERLAGSDIESGPLIYLSGEFKSPRPYRIPLGTAPTLVNVMLSSGGVTDKADLTRIRVMRMAGGKSVVEEVNVQKILDGTGLASDVTLTEGDV